MSLDVPGNSCRCGHDRAWHGHYNGSTACAKLPCLCKRFRKTRHHPEGETMRQRNPVAWARRWVKFLRTDRLGRTPQQRRGL